MIRGVTHIHSHRSWDSAIRPTRLLRELERLDVELALVTDHDNFDGSIEFARLCAAARSDIIVPVAAEIRTERGDLIVVLEPGTSPPPVGQFLQWDDAVRITRDLGGLLWLPHPYRSHHNVEELAAQVDIVEVFNSRCSERQNTRALSLAEEWGSSRAFGVDAHRLREVGNAVVEYAANRTSTIVEILTAPVSCEAPRRGLKSDRMAAEVVNGLKKRRPNLVGYFVMKYLWHRTREILPRS